MNRELNEQNPETIRQRISEFNDRLIVRMRQLLGQESNSCGALQTQNQVPISSDEMLAQTQRKEQIADSKRPSLSTNASGTETNARSKNCLLQFQADLFSGNVADFDSNGTRRWENFLGLNAGDPNPAVAVNLLKDAAINEDFITDSFSDKFESDSEQQAEKTIEIMRTPRAEQLSFLSYAQSASTVFEGSHLFSFKNLIERLENRNLRFRRYECDQCHRKFYNPAALGGHKSKQHPKSSKRYNERKDTYSLRTGERRKRSFLNNL